MEEKEVVVGGVSYVCPRPHPLLQQLLTDALAEDPSPETLSFILGFAERRGFREAMLEVERFLVKNEKL